MTSRRLATVIRELREREKLTQEELANRAKVARGYLAKLEAGHSKTPSIATMQRTARALGVPVTALLE